MCAYRVGCVAEDADAGEKNNGKPRGKNVGSMPEELLALVGQQTAVTPPHQSGTGAVRTSGSNGANDEGHAV